MVAGNLVHKLRSLMGGNAERVALTAKGVEQLRGQLRECAEGLGGEVSARGRAARLAETYLRLNDEGRQRFLKLIALEFGPDPKKVEKAHAAYQKAIGTAEQWKAEAEVLYFDPDVENRLWSDAASRQQAWHRFSTRPHALEVQE